MQGGIYKCVFEKQDKVSFVNYVINNIMGSCMFTVNNPYYNFVEMFDSEGTEVICSEDNLQESINNLEKEFLITMWRENTSIDLIFYFSDDKYDVVDINFDGLKSDEYNQIINDISIAVLENRQQLIGIMADKKGILPEICFKYNDNLCLNFMLNFKSKIRKAVNKTYRGNICLSDLIEVCSQIEKSDDNIFNFVFLTKEQIMMEVFEYKYNIE